MLKVNLCNQKNVDYYSVLSNTTLKRWVKVIVEIEYVTEHFSTFPLDKTLQSFDKVPEIKRVSSALKLLAAKS